MISFRHLLSLCGAIVALANVPLAASAAVTVDPDRTSATFTVGHFLVAHVGGSIPVRSATLEVADDGVPTAVSVTFDVAKLSTQDDGRDKDLRGEHWFDVAADPVMSFESTKITPGAKGAFTMEGTLTMHGVTKPVTIAGSLTGTTSDARGRTHLAYSATAEIDRTQWNVGNVPSAVVGTSIAVSIRLEAIRSSAQPPPS